MKKFISLVLALVMALSLTTVAWAAVGTKDELIAAIGGANAGETIQLTGNITTDALITIDKAITLDLNGYSITRNHTNSAAATLYITTTGVTVKDSAATNGAGIVNTGAGIAIFMEVGAGLTLTDVNVTGSDMGVKVSAGGNLVVDSGAVVTGTNTTSECGDGIRSYGGSVTVNSGAKIAASTTGTAIESYGSSTVTMNGEITSGDYGVQVYGGDVTINGDVTANTAILFSDEDNNGGTYVNDATVTVTGGHIDVATFVKTEDKVPSVNQAPTASVTGGEFSVALPAGVTLPAGTTPVLTTDGTYVLGVVPTMGDKFDLYLADAGMNTALKLKTPTVAGLSFDEKAAKTNKDGSGNVAYIAANNGQYFVKTTNPTVADYAVTDAGKNTVLYYVTVAGTSAANFAYEESVTAFNKFSTYAKCGYVTGTPAVGETYFTASDDLVYMAAAAGTGTNYLLNGKVVSGILVGAPEDHVFTLNGYKYDATLKQNIPTSALCTKCMMNTGSIYLRTKVPATYTLYPTNGEGSNAYTVALPSAAAVVTPSTPAGDKVESAETFDAGIALYVGMSVMAAAGSAVVLKKKD